MKHIDGKYINSHSVFGGITALNQRIATNRFPNVQLRVVDQAHLTDAVLNMRIDRRAPIESCSQLEVQQHLGARAYGVVQEVLKDTSYNLALEYGTSVGQIEKALGVLFARAVESQNPKHATLGSAENQEHRLDLPLTDDVTLMTLPRHGVREPDGSLMLFGQEHNFALCYGPYTNIIDTALYYEPVFLNGLIDQAIQLHMPFLALNEWFSVTKIYTLNRSPD